MSMNVHAAAAIATTRKRGLAVESCFPLEAALALLSLGSWVLLCVIDYARIEDDRDEDLRQQSTITCCVVLCVSSIMFLGSQVQSCARIVRLVASVLPQSLE
ncbi:unnamed protein product, partial [Polarella glacialis]